MSNDMERGGNDVITDFQEIRWLTQPGDALADPPRGFWTPAAPGPVMHQTTSAASPLCSYPAQPHPVMAKAYIQRMEGLVIFRNRPGWRARDGSTRINVVLFETLKRSKNANLRRPDLRGSEFSPGLVIPSVYVPCHGDGAVT
jgi:hypothetical protein